LRLSYNRFLPISGTSTPGIVNSSSRPIADLRGEL
jgi:hypothetical protein